MFKMNPALKVDVILDLLLTRYLYSEIDTQFTVQDIIGDPRHRELLADPPNSTNPEGERTINGGASGVLKRALDAGLLIHLNSKKYHGSSCPDRKRVYQISRPVFRLLSLRAVFEKKHIFDVVKVHYNDCRTIVRMYENKKGYEEEETE
jgi:hypothetical protein